MAARACPVVMGPRGMGIATSNAATAGSAVATDHMMRRSDHIEAIAPTIPSRVPPPAGGSSRGPARLASRALVLVRGDVEVR
jgi:hypothetical protein